MRAITEPGICSATLSACTTSPPRLETTVKLILTGRGPCMFQREVWRLITYCTKEWQEERDAHSPKRDGEDFVIQKPCRA
jgi:hypothetical protein